ncbi:TonB-dependent receptor [Caulobacter sp.]|uniref:TonB-dependent receptor domain-containing protein n=1 Tax=Caulobacter sp. TaxID=78 RepID=UPI001B1005E9|nr:TonB-dependent receptor [Caulobacter sp.]MBO9544561.1 TonB-dependent receptor [Caulobacter sp.]
MDRRVVRARRRGRVGALLSLAVLAPVAAMAANPVATFDQEASNLGLALQRLGQAAGEQLLYAPELTADQRAPALRGRMSVDHALTQLLARTDLAFRRTASGVIVIYRVKPVARPQREPAPMRTAQEIEPVVGLEAVVITSGKRMETLGRSDASVQALSSQMMERAGVRDFDDLARLAPTLTISKTTQPGNNSINVRGVGTYSYSIGTEPSVVVVVDDVPQAFQAMAFTALADVEQVEILRGPQSTLFGKAASAGVIYITTKPASDAFAAHAETLLTDDHEQRASATLTGPISDDLKFRLSAAYSRYRGNVFNLATRQWLNAQSDVNLRAKLVWTPGDNWTVAISPYLTRTLSSCCVGADTYVSPQATLGKGELSREAILRGIVPSPDNHFARYDINARGNATDKGVNIRAVGAVGSWRLTSITALDRYYLYDRQDTDATDLDYSLRDPRLPRGGSSNGGYFRIRAESQELRLNSPTGGRWDYVGGVYVGHTKARRYFVRGSNSLGDYNGLSSLPTTNSTAYSRYISETFSTTYAVFGQGAYALNDRLSILSGARISHEKIGYRFDDLGNGVTYGAPKCSKASPTVPIETCHSDTALSGRIGLQGVVRPGVTAYATYSTGYKGRAYDLTSSLTTRTLLTSGPYAGKPVADAIAAQQPVASETVENYEAGVRFVSPDRNLSWNLTAYQERFSGFQAQSRDDATGLNVLNSIGSVKAQGVETEFSVRFSPRLTLAGAGVYSHAVMDDFDSAACYFGQTAAQGCVGGRQDLSGKTLFNAPRWSLNLNAYYQRPVGGDRRLEVNAGYRWRSRVYYSLLQDPASIERPYGVLDVSVGLGGGGWRISGFVNNVLDKRFAVTRGRDVQWNLVGADGQPAFATHWKPARDSGRHLGVRLAMDY